jgi:predicted amidohydrolase
MKRRAFLKSTVTGMAMVAGSGSKLFGDGLSSEGAADANARAEYGRPVRVVSIGFKATTLLSEITKRIDEEGPRKPDIVLLPETCRGQNEISKEPLHGPTVTAMAALAQRHNMWMAVPIDRIDGARRLNTIVLLDRSGNVVCTYDKLFPYFPEFDVQPPVNPGVDVQVVQTDFGRVGFATCFDVNFPEVWSRLEEKGAELVLWPSAYSAGSSLQAHAINYHYYIVTSTLLSDAIAYDITGERLLYEKSKDINVSRITVDLDRGIYHRNFNIDKRNKLLSEHAQDVVLEKSLEQEAWFVLKAARPGISARALARQYGLEELRDYIARSRRAIDRRRGWEFAEKALPPESKAGQTP